MKFLKIIVTQPKKQIRILPSAHSPLIGTWHLEKVSGKVKYFSLCSSSKCRRHFCAWRYFSTGALSWLPGPSWASEGDQRRPTSESDHVKEERSGTSLVIQWLRLHASTVGNTVSLPGQGMKTTQHGRNKGKKRKEGRSSLRDAREVIQPQALNQGSVYCGLSRDYSLTNNRSLISIPGRSVVLPRCASHLHQLQNQGPWCLLWVKRLPIWIAVHGASLQVFLSTGFPSAPSASVLCTFHCQDEPLKKQAKRGLLLTPAAACCSPGPRCRLQPHRLQSKPRAHLCFLLLFTLRDGKGKWPVLRVASELARILQGNKTNRMYLTIWEDLSWGIGSITEAEKSHHLLSASWGPRKAGGVVPVDLRTRGPWSKVLVWV